MNTKQLTELYEYHLAGVVHTYFSVHDDIDKDAIYTRIAYLRRFYHDLLHSNVQNFYRTCYKLPSEKDRQHFADYQSDSGIIYPLIGILHYRHYQIPIYDDDNGQQAFAVYHYNGEDHIVSGGAFNLYYALDIAFQLDDFFDRILADQTLQTLLERNW